MRAVPELVTLLRGMAAAFRSVAPAGTLAGRRCTKEHHAFEAYVPSAPGANKFERKSSRPPSLRIGVPEEDEGTRSNGLAVHDLAVNGLAVNGALALYTSI